MKLLKNTWVLAVFLSTRMLAQTSVQVLDGLWNYRLDANDVGLEKNGIKLSFRKHCNYPVH